MELVPPDVEYSTITSIKSLEIVLRATADVTRGKRGSGGLLSQPIWQQYLQDWCGRNVKPSYATVNR